MTRLVAATSVLGAVVSMLRPKDESAKAPEAAARRRQPTLAIEEAISEEIEATP